jgi:FkbM family methyltransferase
LVEPVPHVYRLLRENYAGRAGMLFENAVVASKQRPFHYFPEVYCEEHPWAVQMGSLHADRIRWALTYIAEHEFVAGVRPEDLEQLLEAHLPCMTFEELMRRHGIDRFDLINLDTEGTDLEILESIDLSRYRVRAVVVETRPYLEEVGRTDDRIGAWLADRDFDFIGQIDWATDAFVKRSA